MSYRIEKLASGSYDVLLDGEAIASLVKVPYSHSAYWVLELLDETHRPAPFTAPEHTFPSLDDARRFLGIGLDAPPGARSVGFSAGLALGAAA